jgi:hypothetical protein
MICPKVCNIETFKPSFQISNFKFKIISTVLLALLLLPVFSNYTIAQESLPLIVSPARQELVVDPGENTAVTIKFMNESEQPVPGIIGLADFVVLDNNGAPTFLDITNPANSTSRFAASSWVSMPSNQVTIGAKNKILIQAKIKVPENARPGGHYFAVYFEPGGTLKGGLENKESAVLPRIASLVYLKVSGPIMTSAFVSKMVAPQFVEYGPITVESEITNLGDYHITPKGNLTLSNMFGQVVDQNKLEEVNIFPDVSRAYSNKVGTKWMMGQYKTSLTATYGGVGKVMLATIYIWVFPWKVATALVLAAVILIMLLKLTFGRLKQHESDLEHKVEELEHELKEEKKL